MQLSSPRVNSFLNPSQHSFHAYKPYSAKTSAPIPLQNQEELSMLDEGGHGTEVDPCKQRKGGG